MTRPQWIPGVRGSGCECECECECECVYIQMSSGCFRLVGARLRNHFVCGSRFLSGAEITSWGERRKRKGEGAAGLLGPLQLQLVRLLPFNLPRHILQKDVAGSQLKVQFQGEGAADRTCRKRERKAWLSWSVCVVCVRVCGGECVCAFVGVTPKSCNKSLASFICGAWLFKPNAPHCV